MQKCDKCSKDKPSGVSLASVWICDPCFKDWVNWSLRQPEFQSLKTPSPEWYGFFSRWLGKEVPVPKSLRGNKKSVSLGKEPQKKAKAAQPKRGRPRVSLMKETGESRRLLFTIAD